MPFAPSPSHHHFYRYGWYGIPVPVMGGKHGIVFPRFFTTFGPTATALFRNLLGKFTIFRWPNPVAVLAMSILSRCPGGQQSYSGGNTNAPRESTAPKDGTQNEEIQASKPRPAKPFFFPRISCDLVEGFGVPLRFWWKSADDPAGALLELRQIWNTMTSWWTPCEVLQETSLVFTSTLGTGSDDILQSEKAGWTFAENSCLSKTSYRIHWVIKPVPGTSGFSLKLQSHICISAEQCQTLSQGSVCKDMHHANFSAVSFAAAMFSLSSTGSRFFFLHGFSCVVTQNNIIYYNIYI